MRKKIFFMILVGLAFVSVPNSIQAQDSDKVVILSPRVGSVIDAAERERYELFQEIKGFDRGVFLQTPKKTYYAKVVLIGPDGARRDTTIQYSEDVLHLLAERIELLERLREKRYDTMDQPTKIQLAESTRIKTAETVTHDPRQQNRIRQLMERAEKSEKSEVKIYLNNGQEIEGELVSVRDSSVLIAVESEHIPSGLPPPIQGILAINDTLVSHVIVEGSSHVLLGMGVGFVGGTFGGMVIGMLAGSAAATDPVERTFGASFGGGEGAMVGALTGTLLGGLIGGSASESDIEVSLSVPSERSALKKLARFPDKEPKSFQVIK